jgi:16S rRNA A1518/A1519 N6-dimethyltransferase RsmA/KsgA/DIM1 with predicted DNA glycosylase/AP lyase activity
VERHRPRKRFGQHFLADPHYIARIVDAADREIELAQPAAGLVIEPGHDR